jgi:hypothetical protein
MEHIVRPFAVIPLLLFSASLPASAGLLTHVATDASVPGVWLYTIFNDEPIGSPNYLTSLNVLVDAPIVVTGTPDGWNVITDDVSFVFWFSADLALPYPHDVAPGASLAGFTIASSAAVSISSTATVFAWDHAADAPGASSDPLSVPAPSSSSEIPEPTTICLFLGGLGALWIYRARRTTIR